jgi:transcriptional regulator GlxA family with amidase domain
LLPVSGNGSVPGPKPVGLLGFDGVRASDLFGPLEILSAARIHPDSQAPRCYDTSLVGVGAKTFRCETGVVCTATQTLANASTFDTVIIPGGTGIHCREALQTIVDWLTRNAANVRRIVSISAGIYPLAQSGLVNGRSVTTHWKISHDVASRFPKLQIDLTAPFVRDGSFYSCGGGIAPMEVALALVQEDFGLQAALPIARDMALRLRPFGENKRSTEPP